MLVRRANGEVLGWWWPGLAWDELRAGLHAEALADPPLVARQRQMGEQVKRAALAYDLEHVELDKARYEALTKDSAFRDLDVFKVSEGRTLSPARPSRAVQLPAADRQEPRRAARRGARHRDQDCCQARHPGPARDRSRHQHHAQADLAQPRPLAARVTPSSPPSSENNSVARRHRPRLRQVRLSVMLMSRSISSTGMSRLAAVLVAVTSSAPGWTPRWLADPPLVARQREVREQVQRAAFAHDLEHVEIAKRAVLGERLVAGLIELDAHDVGMDRIDRRAHVVDRFLRYVRGADDVERRLAAGERRDRRRQIHARLIPHAMHGP